MGTLLPVPAELGEALPLPLLLPLLPLLPAELSEPLTEPELLALPLPEAAELPLALETVAAAEAGAEAEEAPERLPLPLLALEKEAEVLELPRAEALLHREALAVTELLLLKLTEAVADSD